MILKELSAVRVCLRPEIVPLSIPSRSHRKPPLSQEKFLDYAAFLIELSF